MTEVWSETVLVSELTSLCVCAQKTELGLVNVFRLRTYVMYSSTEDDCLPDFAHYSLIEIDRPCRGAYRLYPQDDE
jgi:hypothetical protein